MQNRRFTRFTKAFCKKAEMLAYSLAEPLDQSEVRDGRLAFNG